MRIRPEVHRSKGLGLDDEMGLEPRNNVFIASANKGLNLEMAQLFDQTCTAAASSLSI